MSRSTLSASLGSSVGGGGTGGDGTPSPAFAKATASRLEELELAEALFETLTAAPERLRDRLGG